MDHVSKTMNPSFDDAIDAVTAVPEIGLLIPCNVTLEAYRNTTRIRILNSREMLGGAGLPDTLELAEDAGQWVERVATSLQG